MLQFILLLAVCPFVTACGKKQVTYNGEVEEKVAVDVSYTMAWAALDAKSETRAVRKQYFPTTKPTRPTKDFCNMRPGLQQMSFGFNSKFFSLNHSDIQPTSSRCIDLQCFNADRKDEMGYNIPSEFEKVLDYTSGVSLESSKSLNESFDIYQEFMSTSTLSHLLFGSRIHELIRGSSDHERYTKIFSYVVTLFTAKFHGDIKPSDNMRSDFEALPMPYEKYPSDYNRFISQYGTSFYSEATFGGRIFMLLKYEKKYAHLVRVDDTNIGRPATKEELIIRTNPHFASNVFEKYFDFQGGLFATDEPLAMWIKSIERTPAVLKGTPFSLCQLLGNNYLCLELEKAMRDEEKHGQIKHAISVLKSLKESSPIKTLITRTLTSHLKFIIPDNDLHLYSQEVKDSPHMTTDSYIRLLQSPKRVEENYNSKDLIHYFVIPVMFGVCSTVETTLVNLSRGEWKLPEKYACVRCFKQKKCKGPASKATTVNHLVKCASGSSSFELCY